MKLIVIGTGGHGKVVADCAETTGRYHCIEFVDNQYPEKQSLGPWPIVAHQDTLAHRYDSDTEVFIAIGDNKIRQRIFSHIVDTFAPKFATLVHASAVVSAHAEIGAGTLVCANATVNPMARVGVGCIINSGAIVEHDNMIDDFVHISVGTTLAGTVSVGQGSFVGVGATVSNNIAIGENVMVGAGAAVITDVPNNQTVVGIPAKSINQK